HALDLIDMFLLGETKYDVTKETAFHRTWCFYIAAVTVWTFQLFLDTNEQGGGGTIIPANSGTEERPANLIQYLGRIRAILSEKEGRAQKLQVPARSYSELFKILVHTNDANILLEELLGLLSPCRWGVSECCIFFPNLLFTNKFSSASKAVDRPDPA